MVAIKAELRLVLPAYVICGIVCNIESDVQVLFIIHHKHRAIAL